MQRLALHITRAYVELAVRRYAWLMYTQPLTEAAPGNPMQRRFFEPRNLLLFQAVGNSIYKIPSPLTSQQ